jgi:hypothetical protein
MGWFLRTWLVCAGVILLFCGMLFGMLYGILSYQKDYNLYQAINCNCTDIGNDQITITVHSWLNKTINNATCTSSTCYISIPGDDLQQYKPVVNSSWIWLILAMSICMLVLFATIIIYLIWKYRKPEHPVQESNYHIKFNDRFVINP